MDKFNDELYERLEQELPEIWKEEFDRELGTTKSEVEDRLDGAPTGAVKSEVAKALNNILEYYRRTYLDTDKPTQVEVEEAAIEAVPGKKALSRQKTALIRRRPQEEIPKRRPVDKVKWLTDSVEGLVLEAQRIERESWAPDDQVHNDPLEANRRLSSAAIKEYREIDTFLKQGLRPYFPEQLEYTRKDQLPTRWMKRDVRISRNIDTYPLWMPIMNFIYNQSRGLNKETIDQVQQSANGKTYSDNKYPISLFTTNNEFYEKITKALRCKKITVQKYLKACTDSGIFSVIGKDGRNGRILSDGYYTPMGQGTWRKRSRLVKTDGAIVQALRTFNPEFN